MLLRKVRGFRSPLLGRLSVGSSVLRIGAAHSLQAVPTGSRHVYDAHSNFPLLFFLVVRVQVGDPQSSEAMFIPRNVHANLKDEIQFTFNVPSQSVTSGFNCQRSVLPAVQFDSGVRPEGSLFLLNVSTANGFTRGSVYNFFSSSCETSGVDLNALITVSQSDTSDTTIGIAIGLTSGLFGIALIFVLVGNVLMRSKYKNI